VESGEVEEAGEEEEARTAAVEVLGDCASSGEAEEEARTAAVEVFCSSSSVKSSTNGGGDLQGDAK